MTTPVKLPTKYVAGYIRVSSSRQVAEGDSLEAQQAAIARMVDQRGTMEEWRDYELKYYVDAGRSGKDQNRPQLQKLRRDIEAGKVAVVVVYKLDRITRSLLDFAELWALFKRYGVELVSIRDQFETSGAMGRAMLHIVMVFAQLERELTGERTLSTMLHRASEGLWNFRAPPGYKIGENRKLVIDPEFAPVIKEHFFDAVERLGRSAQSPVTFGNWESWSPSARHGAVGYTGAGLLRSARFKTC